MEKIISGMEGFCLKNQDGLGADDLPCDLLIFETGNDLRKEILLLHSIKTSGLAQEIFLTSPNLDPETVTLAKRVGVKGFFKQPIEEKEVRDALLKFKDGEKKVSPAQEDKKHGKTIYTIGCKGGVGTTMLALNLAESLVKLDRSRFVVLTDMMRPFGMISILTNVTPSPNWAQVAKNISRIDSALLKSILSRHPAGFFILPSPPWVVDSHKINLEVVERLLPFMQEAIDFIVIDGEGSFSDVSAKLLKMAETILLVTGLNKPCLVNAKRFISTLRQRDPAQEEKIKIIVNGYQDKPSVPLERVEQELNKEVFLEIPNDFKTAMEAMNHGKFLAEVGREREISQAIRRLASFFLTDDPKTGGKERRRFMADDHWYRPVLMPLYKPGPSG